jgi:hypothetical protein
MSETQTLVAGRGLDALIAEKVFGWTDLIVGDNVISGAAGTPPNTEAQQKELPSWSTYWETVPHFSTDINVAWAILDRFVGDRQYVQVEYEDDGGWKWRCAIGAFHEASASSPPEAICLAALKAVEVA